jgi:sulfur relay (sulfurtransferase) DsrF/TusC family protein
MDGHEHITPSSLVTFFQLYPRYDMDTQMRLSDVLLEMSLTHKNLVEEIRVEKEKAAAEVEARKSAAEDVKSRTVQGQTG